MLWLILYPSLGAAADPIHCEEPSRPKLRDLQVSCEPEEIVLEALIVSDTGLASVVAAIMPDQEYPGFPIQLHKIDEIISGERTSVYYNSVRYEDIGEAGDELCDERLEVRFRAVNEDGIPGERSYFNFAPLLINGSFENGLDEWGWGGNADADWETENQITPYEGTAMGSIGWPTNATSVGGYLWQPLGALPRGTYALSWRDTVATHPSNWPEGAGCADELPRLYAGFLSNKGDRFEEVSAQLFTAADMWCGAERVQAGSYVSRTEWVERSIEFAQNSADPKDDIFAFFSVTGGYAHQGHITYLDDVRLTGNTKPSACEISARDGDYIEAPFYTALPQEVTASPSSTVPGRVYDHGEEQVLSVLRDSCDSCSTLSGGYGSRGNASMHGFDGVLLHNTDNSALLIEVKSTYYVRQDGQWAEPGPSKVVFEDGGRIQTEQGTARELMNHIRRAQNSSSNTYRTMCSDGSRGANGTFQKRKCMQLQGLWNAAVLSQICLNDRYSGNTTHATQIEDSLDAGTSCTSWGAYHERTCEGGSWHLTWGSRDTEEGWPPYTPVSIDEEMCDVTDPGVCMLRWLCTTVPDQYITEAPPEETATLHARRGADDVLATILIESPQSGPAKPDQDDGFWRYLRDAFDHDEDPKNRICPASDPSNFWSENEDTGYRDTGY